MESTLTAAALKLLLDKHPDRYSSGFLKVSLSIIRAQIKPLWAKVCEAESVSPDDYPLPKWDMVARATGHRKDPRRR
jgi:hypothetical protein